jgi:hypothetical protein
MKSRIDKILESTLETLWRLIVLATIFIIVCSLSMACFGGWIEHKPIKQVDIRVNVRDMINMLSKEIEK